MGTKSMLLVALMLVCVLALTAAPVTAAEETAQGQMMRKGGIAVMAEKTLGTVETVDTQKRMLTLKMADGTSKKVRVGKQVVNFDEIKAGDKINATMIDAMGVSLRKPGTAPAAGESATVALSPKGAMPGMVMADTEEMTGKVTDVEPMRHRVELQGPEGKTMKVRVARDVDLKNVKKGDEVVMRMTNALVLKVEKP